ncbi:MAG: S-methyl-5'-thioadenosine phosphorylase, partial [Anaerolineae bacterium]
VEEAGGHVHRGGAFITIEGPRFSTKAESETYRAWGMDIIGMTTSPEAFLAREAGMCYGVLAHITDYDVWHESEEPVTVDIVIPRLNANVTIAKEALALLIPRLASKESTCNCAQALENAIITARDRIPDDVKQDLDLIVGPFL